jgi:hypothetical protein
VYLKFVENDIVIVVCNKSCENGSTNFLILGEYELEYKPKITAENEVVIDNDLLQKIDSTIEKVADFLSVSFSSERIISSFSPFVAFEADDESESQWLNRKDGIKINFIRNNPTTIYNEIDLFKYSKNLDDREGGIKILSEVINCNHKSGKFRDLIRFYERSFGVSGDDLIEPLTNFLKGNKFCYSKQEIKNWLGHRNPITHADKRKNIVFEKDVAPFIQRMLQAAKFILLNKKVWKDSSYSTRNLWKPKCGTSDSTGKLFTTQDSTSTIQFVPMDIFNSFALDTKVGIQFVSKLYWYDNDLMEKGA